MNADDADLKHQNKNPCPFVLSALSAFKKEYQEIQNLKNSEIKDPIDKDDLTTPLMWQYFAIKAQHNDTVHIERF